MSYLDDFAQTIGLLLDTARELILICLAVGAVVGGVTVWLVMK